MTSKNGVVPEVTESPQTENQEVSSWPSTARAAGKRPEAVLTVTLAPSARARFSERASTTGVTPSPRTTRASALLSAGLASGPEAPSSVTVTTFTASVPAGAVSSATSATWKTSRAPNGRLGRVQVSVPATGSSTGPPLASSSVKSAGRTSVTTTPVGVSDPRFSTTTAKSTVSPGCTDPAAGGLVRCPRRAPESAR